MIILGIDPGYAIVGYGGIKFLSGKYIYLGSGAITTPKENDFSARLEYIYEKIKSLFSELKPNQVAIEKLYFQSNHKTAIEVSEARGVILLAAKKSKTPIFEYTPLQVKTSVTGYGRAEKRQVMLMTKKLLKLKEIPKPDDAADALAIAVCHANQCGLRQLIINKI